MLEDPQPSLSLLRADDLLALTLEFVNLVLDTSQPQPRLVRSQAGQDAFIIVHFPPQHIGEESFTATGSPSSAPGPPIGAVLAGPTRLAFLIPPNIQSLPFTLGALLDWGSYQLIVAPNALPDLGIDLQVFSPAPPDKFPRPREPASTETAIELPYRIILSPDASAAWTHSVKLVASSQRRTELWHTRLLPRRTEPLRYCAPSGHRICSRRRQVGGLSRPLPRSLPIRTSGEISSRNAPTSVCRPMIARFTSLALSSRKS